MKVIVAGIPRCGTTYMWRSLSGAEAVDIAHSYNGTVIKTHSPAPLHMIGYRAVFMFGDIVNAVISTAMRAQTLPHFINCGYFGVTVPSIYDRDFLRYERMFDSWNAYNGYPVLLLRYETCHQHAGLISDFLECDVNLLPFKERQTRREIVQPDILERIESTYSDLIAKVAGMPDYTIIHRHAAGPWQHMQEKLSQHTVSEG